MEWWLVLLLVLLVAVLVAMDWWANRTMRRLGARPNRALLVVRIVNMTLLVAALAYALYVVATTR